MDLDIRQNDNICAFKIKGRFNSVLCVREFDTAVESALASGHNYLILDLADMPVIDSAGIGSVVNALKRARQVGGDVRLVNPSPFALKTFKMVGILSLFGVHPSEEEAAAAFGKK